MLLCMLAKQHRKMMAGGTAQMPSCPAPPVPGGRIQLVEGGVSLERLQSSACLCERALSNSSCRGAGTAADRKDVILWTKHTGEN